MRRVHLFALYALAVAQPLLGLLGDNAEFPRSAARQPEGRLLGFVGVRRCAGESAGIWLCNADLAV